MRSSMLTARMTAIAIGVLFLAADGAGAAGLLMGGRLVSAPVDVAAVEAHGYREPEPATVSAGSR